MMRQLMAAAASFPLAELASAEIDFSAEGAVSSMVIDRGEQIGGPSLEIGVSGETALGAGALYAGVYRLTPFGEDQAAYADEFDYTVGYAWAGEGYEADVSANWLTYPGEGETASLELAGELALAAPLNPVILGFYDAEFEDYGLEVTAGPEWQAGDWTLYAIGRVGFVVPGDGSESRSYGGAEAGAYRPVGAAAEFGVYGRFEAADADTFADEIERGTITHSTHSGFAAGIVLSAAF